MAIVTNGQKDLEFLRPLWIMGVNKKWNYKMLIICDKIPLIESYGETIGLKAY